jgi:hypothetical protein
MQQDYGWSFEPEAKKKKIGRSTKLRPDASIKCMEFIQGMSKAH